MMITMEPSLSFEEIEAADAPSADSFWWGMWSGIAVVTAVVVAT